MTGAEPAQAVVASSLSDKVVVVTGAARGIGAAIAHRLARSGACVVGVDREPSSVSGTSALTLDLGDPLASASLIGDVVRSYGRIDALVNNAGLARHAPVTEIDLTELDLMWAVNVRAVIQLTRDAMRAMAPPAGNGGRIVNVVSTAGITGQPGEAAYCATKFAVRGFTEAAAEEGRLNGVHVSGLYPAGVATAFWDDAVGDRLAFTGDKQWLSPDDVAAQVAGLLELPPYVDVPSLVVRHTGDTDLAGVAAKLEHVRRRRSVRG